MVDVAEPTVRLQILAAELRFPRNQPSRSGTALAKKSLRLSAPLFLTVRTAEEVERQLELIRASAARVQAWISTFQGDPLDLLRHMKFDTVGFHPIEDRPLNLVEQINQTWTYAVALAATAKLLERHPQAGGFKVAPGAHMSLALDIMSLEDGEVGAETFAAVHPRNNGKLAGDLAKMGGRPERHRYVFFCSPAFPGYQRLSQFEANGVEVWSVDI